MEDKDYIQELFSQKLKNQEAPVNPDLWSAISSQIAAPAAASTTIISTSLKWIIGLSTASVLTVGAVYFLSNDQKPSSLPVKTDLKTPEKSDQTPQNEVQNATLLPSGDQEAQAIQFVIPNSGLGIDIDDDFPINGPSKQDEHIGDDSKNTLQIISDPAVIELANDPKIDPEIYPQTSNDSDSTKIIDPQNQVEKTMIGILPNVFTPNGDSENDLLFIELKGLTNFSLTILNNKTEKVFYTEDLNFKWDGKDFNSDVVPAGEYIYFFTAKNHLGESISKHSRLTINR